jgi:DNA-binding NarL/FixJ family response regulator
MRVLLVDDHSLFRSGLAHLFNSQPDFEVVGEADTVKEALDLVETNHPDLIIMDVGLPDGSGLDAITKILHKKDIKIVFLTIHASEESAFTAISSAQRVFNKAHRCAGVTDFLRGLQRGELAVSRRTLSRYVNELIPLHSIRGGGTNGLETTLTMREIDVLAGLSTGDSNSEIARRLSISENTVKIHVHNILHKLKMPGRQEAAAYARRHGLKYRVQAEAINDPVRE